jgi:hypothetical protein
LLEVPPRLVEFIDPKLLRLDRLENDLTAAACLGLQMLEPAVDTLLLLLLFGSGRPVEEAVAELPEQVSSDDEDIDGNDLFD